jgi:hypothetical protein
MKTFYKLLLGVWLGCLCLVQAFGQGTDASITGVVYEKTVLPLPGATIQLKNESTGFQTATLTGADGKFSFKQLPLGGPYTVTVTHIGYAESKKTGYTLNQGNHLKVDINLSESTTDLQEIVVSSNGFRSRNDRLAAATSVSAGEIRQLPTNNRNFSNLAQLSPLVASGLNIGGQSSRNDAITIDGVNAKEPSFGEQSGAPYTLSLEALREFEVVTNSYDVTEGRNSNGSVKAVTKSGTNQFHGSVFGYFWDARLSADKNLLKQAVPGETKQQRGFSLGGPIIRDRLHFFVTYDGERYKEQYDLWSQSTRTDIVQNNRGQRLVKDSLDRAIQILQEKYGVGPGRQYGFFQRDKTLDTWFAKLDFQINSVHKLTVRGLFSDYLQPNNNNSDIGAYGIHDAGYDFIVKDKNFLVSLRSQFSPNVSNEFKLGYSFNDRGNRINTAEHPQLWINLKSEVDGKIENAIIVGRYNRWTPEIQKNNVYSIINDTYLTKGRFNFVFGTQNTITNSSGIYTHDVKGRFDFNSLAALEAMQPDRYQRKFTNPGQELRDPVETNLLEFSGYGQASTELVPNLQATLGLRYDLAVFTTAPDYNPTLEQELGYRNNVKPVDWNNIQPRINFTYDINGKGRDIVNLGAGWFTGQMVTRPYIYALIDNGIRFTGIDIQKGVTKDDAGNPVPVPTPDYASYANDYNTIPGTGLTTAELNPSKGSAAQVVRFVDKDLQLPSTFKANLSYHRYLNDWLRVGVSGYYTRTHNMLVMENVNLRKDPSFILAGEGGREVYTPIENMGKTTVQGIKAAEFPSAKISNKFADALMFTNGYQSSFMAVVLDAAVALPNQGKFTVSYTRARAKGAERYRNEDDQRFVGATYYDDYDFINNGYSPNDFRQKLLLNLTSPKVGGFTFGAFLNMVEAGRFSALLSQSEVMGTNIRDLNGYTAYIFDPKDPNTLALQGEQFVQDLQYVFDNTSPEARKYLNNNIGKYAQPNGGLMGWRGDLNVRVTNEIQLYKEHHLLLNFDCFNVLNLVKPTWGGYNTIINENLYDIASFDAATQSYKYKVRTNYGQRRYEGNGFKVMLGVKYVF